MNNAISEDDHLTKRFSIETEFDRFHQKNDIFSRAVWDDKIDPKAFFLSYDIANYKSKKSKGFDHWDYALRNASWHLTDVVSERNFSRDGDVEGFTSMYTLQTPGPKEKIQVEDVGDVTNRVKVAAKLFGAGMVGVAKLDQRWIYASTFNRKDQSSHTLKWPGHLTNVIVLVLPMDYALGQTFPAAVSGTTTGLGYSSSLHCSSALAQFITNLGYEAHASMNDTALNIPLAIQAGLGEYGRHGLLITPKYGPNVRLAKVFTDLPLKLDHPIEFGVKQFCQICQQCAGSCPSKAIPSEIPQNTPINVSNHTGIRKWTVDAEKCFKFWVGMNSDCAICIRVCPYNKDYTKWWNQIGIKLANGPLRRFMLLLDRWIGFGKRMAPKHWWNRMIRKVST
ncbi:MAG: reductive dehalogenase [Saprospiraceae bacterium]|nr:reductive dehalogenase [Saprospiraceae bacterium]